MKKTAKILATVLLLAVDLLLLAYVLRRPLFEATIRELVERELSAATGCEVTVGAIRGNWLTEIRVLGAQLRGGPGTFLQRVDDLDVTAIVAPLLLLEGDLSGLRAARAVARRVVIDTGGGFPPGGEAVEGEEGETPDLTRLLPGGARAACRDLTLGTGDTWRSGPLSVRLEPGAGRRHLRVDHRWLTGRFALEQGSADLLAVDGHVQVEDPGDILAILETPMPVRSGRLDLSASADLGRLHFRGHAQLHGLRHERAVLESSSLYLELDERSLTVEGGSLRLPGLTLATGGLRLPSPLAQTPMDPLLAVGDAQLRIDDLEPYRELLTEELLEHMPIQANLYAWLESGRAHVGACRIATAGAVVIVRRGSVPLLEPDRFRSERVDLTFLIEVPEAHEFAIPGLGPLTTQGRIAGSFQGSLEQPRLQASLVLGPTRAAGHRAEKLIGDVVFGDGAVSVRRLEATGLASAESPEPRAELRGDFTVLLPAGDSGLRIEADLHGTADPRLLAELGAETDLAERLQPVTFRVEGALTDLDRVVPRADGTLMLEDLRLDDLDPAELSLEVTTRDDVLTVERCELRGPAALDLTGTVTLLEEPELEVRVRIPPSSLALLSRLTTLPSGEGSVTGSLLVRGPLRDLVLEADVQAELADASALVTGSWDEERMGPRPHGPVRLRVTARQDAQGVHVERLDLSSEEGATRFSLSGSGPVPAHWDPRDGLRLLDDAAEDFALTATAGSTGPEGVDLPWSWTAGARIAATEILIELSGSTGPGGLSGSGSIGAGWRQLLTEGAEIDGATLSGDWQLRTLSLDVLPPALLGLTVLTGKVDGTLALGGTIAAPEPRLELELSDGSLRAPGLPRLSGLSGDLSLGPRRAEVRSLTALLGAGPIRLEATLEHERPLWEGLEGAQVRAQLKGEQALIYNTTEMKLRGDVDLEITGTTERMNVTGSLRITTGRFARRINFVPGVDVLRGRGGAPMTDAVELSLLDPELGDRIELDVAVQAMRDFEVRTHVLDAGLRPDVRLRGTGTRAWLEGTVTANEGRIRMPGSTLFLQSLLITFPSQDPTHPLINATAAGRRHGYRVQATVTGPLLDPQVVLSSSPALPAEELVVLLTTGTLPDELRRQGAAGQARLLGSYLAQELAAWYMGGETTEDSENFFERFSVETGHEISDSGLESVLVEFRISDRVYLQAERDIYEAYNGGVVLRFRFR